MEGNRRSGREVPGYAPPGWPEEVHPPGAPDWEATAAAFLFDCCPADFRRYPVLRRHPVVLARFAAQFVSAQSGACAEGLPGVRTSLTPHVPPHVVQQAAEALSEQQALLVRRLREVGLVEAALRGRLFTPKL